MKRFLCVFLLVVCMAVFTGCGNSGIAGTTMRPDGRSVTLEEAFALDLGASQDDIAALEGREPVHPSIEDNITKWSYFQNVTVDGWVCDTFYTFEDERLVAYYYKTQGDTEENTLQAYEAIKEQCEAAFGEGTPEKGTGRKTETGEKKDMYLRYREYNVTPKKRIEVRAVIFTKIKGSSRVRLIYDPNEVG